SQELSVTAIARHYRAYLNNTVGRTAPTIVQNGNQAGFPNLDPEESRVSIIGHCTQGGSSLRSSRYVGTQRAEIGPVELIRRLSGDGSPDDQVQFELIACLAGSASGKDNSCYLNPQLVVNNATNQQGQDVGFIKIGVLMTDTVTWTSSFGEQFYRDLR